MCRGSTPYCLLISSSSGTNSEYMTPATPSLFDKRPPGYAPDIYREKSRPEFCSGQAGFCVNAERQTASMSNKNAHDHSPVSAMTREFRHIRWLCLPFLLFQCFFVIQTKGFTHPVG